MDEDFRALADRVREESAGPAGAAGTGARDAVGVCDRLLTTPDNEELAGVLVERERPLWAREIAAFRLGCAGDRRAFEALVLLLNHRDAERCVSASYALARLGDPRTARAAAALATNPLRTAYAVHAVRLLTELAAPESVPALIETLERLSAPEEPHWRVALACVEGLERLADPRAREALEAARGAPRLTAACGSALARLG